MLIYIHAAVLSLYFKKRCTRNTLLLLIFESFILIFQHPYSVYLIKSVFIPLLSLVTDIYFLESEFLFLTTFLFSSVGCKHV